MTVGQAAPGPPPEPTPAHGPPLPGPGPGGERPGEASGAVSITMFERRVHALAAGAALLAVAAVLVVVVASDPTGSPLQPLDDGWRRFVEGRRTGWATQAAEALATIGSTWVTLPLRLLVVGVLAVHRRWLQLGAFVGAVVSSELCIGPVKALVGRPRPPGALVTVEHFSFPSGHAIAGAVTAFGLVVILLAPRPRRLLWIGAAAAFAGLMAMSRTYLGVHWLSDVLTGVCIGTGFALAWPAGLELLRDRREARRAAAGPPPVRG